MSPSRLERGLYLVTPDERDPSRLLERVAPLLPFAACLQLRAKSMAHDALRDRGLGYLKLGHLHGARADLARYLQLNPDATDAASLHEKLVDLGGPRRPH
jgi:regulator of sirC expression with transglutaminase-like and TPR domain